MPSLMADIYEFVLTHLRQVSKLLSGGVATFQREFASGTLRTMRRVFFWPPGHFDFLNLLIRRCLCSRGIFVLPLLPQVVTLH